MADLKKTLQEKKIEEEGGQEKNSCNADGSLPIKRQRRSLAQQKDSVSQSMKSEPTQFENALFDDTSSDEPSQKPAILFKDDNTVDEEALKVTEDLTGDALHQFLENDLLGPCDDEFDAIFKLCKQYDL